jgi:hypothetical protein
MARIRSIHPGIWTDEQFVELSLAARLFMIGLWGEADDYGVVEWRPTKLKMRLAPADAIDAAALMTEISDAGFIVRIERDGKPYAIVRNFRKWQRPKNPSAPIIPIDDEIRAIIGLPQGGSPTPVLPQPSASPTVCFVQMEDGGEEDVVGGDKKNIDNIYRLDTATSASERPSSPPFPSDGSISFGVWGEIAREERPGVDPDLLAQAFRSYAGNLKPPLSLQSSNIEARFRRFCTTHNFNFKRGAR